MQQPSLVSQAWDEAKYFSNSFAETISGGIRNTGPTLRRIGSEIKESFRIKNDMGDIVRIFGEGNEEEDFQYHIPQLERRTQEVRTSATESRRLNDEGSGPNETYRTTVPLYNASGGGGGLTNDESSSPPSHRSSPIRPTDEEDGRADESEHLKADLNEGGLTNDES